MRVSAVFAAALAAFVAAAEAAGPSLPAGFHPGTAIPEFGPVASVESDMAIPKKAKFAIRFDVDEAAKPGELNRAIVSAARFLNMSAEAGVAPENVRLAIVVHGGAAKDLTVDARYYTDHGAANANAALIGALADKGVAVILCGQSAAAHKISKDELLPSVKMALSAMHAHALLNAEGYTLNPF